MDQNPYAAPSLDMDARMDRASSEATSWFAVGQRKLMVMSLLTVGVYSFYWFARQYQVQKSARRESTWPLARAIFSVFFAHDLFRRVEAAAYRVDVHPSWSSGVLGTLYVVFSISGRVLDKVSDKLATGSVATALALISLATVFGIAYPIVQVQGTVNQLLQRERPDHDKNERFTGWNWFVMAIGVSVIALGTYGMVSPSDGETTEGDDAVLDVSQP